MSVNLSEVIGSHINNYDSQLFTSIPAVILEVSGDPSIKYVKVQPTIKVVGTDGLVSEIAPISKVPVVFPSGGGGILSFPLKVGDTVLLVFSQSNISNWLEGDGSKVKPETSRSHNINDAIAIPCLYPFSKNLEPSKDNVELKYNKNSLSLKKNGGTKLSSDSGNVSIESSSNDVDITTSSKFSVTNDSEELISLLSEVIDAISQITTSTINGPATVINNKAAFTSLKSRLDTFKK